MHSYNQQQIDIDRNECLWLDPDWDIIYGYGQPDYDNERIDDDA